jgi:hypothetical protein
MRVNGDRTSMRVMESLQEDRKGTFILEASKIIYLKAREYISGQVIFIFIINAFLSEQN